MKNIVMVMAMLLASGVAAAQQNVRKAMGDLMNDKSAVKVQTKKYEHDMGGEAETYCHYTVLQFDKRQAGKIAKVEEAFDKDMQATYYSMYQTPKIRADQTQILYGPDLEYSVTFGAKKSHNYRVICTEDPQNTGKRHAYAMVWYDEGDGVRCLLYQIYGRRPGKKSGMKLTPLGDFMKDWAGSTTVVDDHKVHIITGNGSDIVAADVSFDKISDDTDFLLLFGNLRVAFLDAIKDADKKVLQTGIALKLVKLCKAHAKLLNEQEKNTCKKSLQEMIWRLEKTNPDTFIKGVLQEADTSLN